MRALVPGGVRLASRPIKIKTSKASARFGATRRQASPEAGVAGRVLALGADLASDLVSDLASDLLPVPPDLSAGLSLSTLSAASALPAPSPPSARFRFLSLSFLKSVSYQPLPARRKEGVVSVQVPADRHAVVSPRTAVFRATPLVQKA